MEAGVTYFLRIELPKIKLAPIIKAGPDQRAPKESILERIGLAGLWRTGTRAGRGWLELRRCVLDFGHQSKFINNPNASANGNKTCDTEQPKRNEPRV